MTFYVIDGHSQIYRACLTASGTMLTAPSGEPTKGTYYFFRMLLKLARDKQPEYLAMAVDSPKNRYFRRSIFPAYKTQRSAHPPEITTQRNRIIQIVKALGIPVVERVSYEADDIIASLVKKFQSEDVHTYIVSRDKDMHQLLNARVSLYDPMVEEVTTFQDARIRWGVNPGMIPDVQAIAGDSSDGIPGVRGVGLKGATELVQRYGSIKGIKENAHALEGRKGALVRKAAEDGTLDLMLALTRLRKNVCLGLTAKDLRFDGIDLTRVSHIFEELGIRRWS